MSEHLTAQTVQRYSQRALLPRELIETDAHLASCARCRQLVSETEETDRTLEYLRAGLHAQEATELEHPSAAQLAAYGDRQLDEFDREIIDGHLLVCADCAEALSDLQDFLALPIPASPAATPIAGRVSVPDQVPGAAPRQYRPSRPSLWESVSSFWPSQFEWMSLRTMGATAALLLLIGVGALIWYSRRDQKVDPHVARNQPSPVATLPNATPLPSIAATPSPAIETPSPGTSPPKDERPGPSPANRNPNGLENPSMVALQDGSGVRIDDAGRITGLEALAPAEQQAVAQTVKTQQVEIPASLDIVRGGVDTLRSGSGPGLSFPILGPLGTAVLTDRPTLRWGALTGARSYVVNVYDRNFNKVVSSEPQASTEWTPPRPLERGQVYSWHVVAVRDGQSLTSPEPPAPEARFIILDQTKTEALERARQSYANSHLTMGTLYARAGLLDEAEREFQQFLRAHPGSRMARKLLRSVQTLRGSKR
jgi:hypothetical protein